MSNVMMMPLTKREKAMLDKIYELNKLTVPDLTLLLFNLKLGLNDGLFTPEDIKLLQKVCRRHIKDLRDAIACGIAENGILND